jgi:hypothetical protein
LKRECDRRARRLYPNRKATPLAQCAISER